MSDSVKLDGNISPIYQTASPLRFSDTAVAILVATADVISITFASVVSSLLYNLFANGSLLFADEYFGLGVVAAVLFVFVAKSWGLYGFSTLLGFDHRFGRLAVSWLLVVLLLVLFLFLLKIGAEFSRGTVLLYGVLGPVFVIGARAVSARYLRAAFDRGATVGRRAVVIGAREQLATLTSLD